MRTTSKPAAAVVKVHRTFVGTAGWSVPKTLTAGAEATGTHLERYGSLFTGVEINSSFYRPHARATYARWAAAVPAEFRFAIKLPRRITHDLRLQDTSEPLAAFLEETSGLGNKRGPLLIQLPPSLAFEQTAARRFFDEFRTQHADASVCEPRHASWFEADADGLLRDYRIARVAADPARVATADEPGGWRGLSYFRLHGSPRTYWSSYSSEYLNRIAQHLADQSQQHDAWCIFDNTASGAAAMNAWDVKQHLATQHG